MKIDVRSLDELLSKSERRSFEIKLIARLKRLLSLCEQRSRALQKDSDAHSFEALGEIADEEAEQIIDRWYFSGLLSWEWERERKDIITVLAAIFPPDVTPYGLSSQWDLDAIEEVLSSRRAAQPHLLEAKVSSAEERAEFPPALEKSQHQAKESKRRRLRAPGLRDAIETVFRERGRPVINGGLPWKDFRDRVWALCNVKPGTPGYGNKTIQRVVDELDKSQKNGGLSAV